MSLSASALPPITAPIDDDDAVAQPHYRPLAVVTGASSGIGRELAALCAEHAHDLVLAADQPEVAQTASALRTHGVDATAVEADLSTPEGVQALIDAIGGRPVDVLMANAGHGLGQAFLDQSFDAIRHVVDTNVTGTLRLLHHVGRGMRERRQGRILITGSIAGLMPGTYQAVYNGSKAFIDSFAVALRHELQDSGVSVTCLMPGATDTAFFERAGMLDTRVGQGAKEDPAKVARVGWDAMMNGDSEVVSGWKNKLQAVMATVTPADLLAEVHRRMSEPGGGNKG